MHAYLLTKLYSRHLLKPYRTRNNFQQDTSGTCTNDYEMIFISKFNFRYYEVTILY